LEPSRLVFLQSRDPAQLPSDGVSVHATSISQGVAREMQWTHRPSNFFSCSPPLTPRLAVNFYLLTFFFAMVNPPCLESCFALATSMGHVRIQCGAQAPLSAGTTFDGYKDIQSTNLMVVCYPNHSSPDTNQKRLISNKVLLLSIPILWCSTFLPYAAY
jgi:hypothetical protein